MGGPCEGIICGSRRPRRIRHQYQQSCHQGPFRLQQRQPGVHALQAGVGPDPVQAAQEPWLQDRPVQRLVGGRALQGLGEVQPQVGFLDLSGRLVMGQVAVISALRAVR